MEQCSLFHLFFKAEHTIDRFPQVRDVYGHIVEETPVSRELDLLNRYLADIADLRKVSPEHVQGQYYERHNLIHYMDVPDDTGCRPECPASPVPDGVPRWAWRQSEQLRYYKHIINWYIDNRMVENGEMGGGLSDEGDFIVQWVFLVQMGCDPEKIYRGMERNTDAFYDQGMMTNGLCSIKADELHSSEEGTIAMAAVCGTARNTASHSRSAGVACSLKASSVCPAKAGYTFAKGVPASESLVMATSSKSGCSSARRTSSTPA